MKAAELPALTGIRFYLATLVFLAHFHGLPGLESLGAYRVFTLGNVGVSLFFVLSGYILAYNYAGGFEQDVSFASWRRFVWARLSKIYPLHLLTLILCIPIQIAAHLKPWNWKVVAGQISLTQCFIPVPTSLYTEYLNTPSWSISCELFFYLLAPWLIWLCLPGRLGRAMGAVLLYVALFALIAAWHPKTNEGTLWFMRFAPVRLFEFWAGVVAGVCHHRSLRPTASTARMLRYAGMGSLVLAIAVMRAVPVYLATGPLFVPGAVMLLSGLADGHGRLARHLSGRWIVLLGCSSFAFYMIHTIVLRLAKGAIVHGEISLAPTWAGFGTVGALFVLTQLLSIALFKYFESPAQIRLRQLFKRPPNETGA